MVAPGCHISACRAPGGMTLPCGDALPLLHSTTPHREWNIDQHKTTPAWSLARRLMPLLVWLSETMIPCTAQCAAANAAHVCVDAGLSHRELVQALNSQQAPMKTRPAVGGAVPGSSARCTPTLLSTHAMT